MSDQHTPTPWYVYAGGGIRTMDEEYVPLFQAANAAFIVRAVNAHDDLVAALTRIANHPWLGPEASYVMAKSAKAALAKAALP